MHFGPKYSPTPTATEPHSSSTTSNIAVVEISWDGQSAAKRGIRYRAFGKRFTLSGSNPARRDPSFQNRTYDAGLGIYDYRNRSFDPATGRFLQRDPVLGGDSLFNPYVFPGNNPVGNVDPMGLCGNKKPNIDLPGHEPKPTPKPKTPVKPKVFKPQTKVGAKVGGETRATIIGKDAHAPFGPGTKLGEKGPITDKLIVKKKSVTTQELKPRGRLESPTKGRQAVGQATRQGQHARQLPVAKGKTAYSEVWDYEFYKKSGDYDMVMRGKSGQKYGYRRVWRARINRTGAKVIGGMKGGLRGTLNAMGIVMTAYIAIRANMPGVEYNYAPITFTDKSDRKFTVHDRGWQIGPLAWKTRWKQYLDKGKEKVYIGRWEEWQYEREANRKYGYVNTWGQFVPGTERKFLPFEASDGSLHMFEYQKWQRERDVQEGKCPRQDERAKWREYHRRGGV